MLLGLGCAAFFHFDIRISGGVNRMIVSELRERQPVCPVTLLKVNKTAQVIFESLVLPFRRKEVDNLRRAPK